MFRDFALARSRVVRMFEASFALGPAKSDRIWPNVARFGPALAKFSPSSADLAPEVDRFWPKLVKHELTSTNHSKNPYQHCPDSAEVGQHRIDIGRDPATIGQHLRNQVTMKPTLAELTKRCKARTGRPRSVSNDSEQQLQVLRMCSEMLVQGLEGNSCLLVPQSCVLIRIVGQFWASLATVRPISVSLR